MLAANNAFWSLDTSELQEVAGHLNINLDCCVTLHEILFTMVSSLTKKSEGEVLDILYKRVKDLDASTLFSAELVEVTEAATDGLDETDKDLLKQHQKSCPGMLKQTKDFKKAHLARVSSFHKVRSQAAAGSKAKRARTSKQAFSECHDDKYDISQPEAKRFLLPKAWIWRTAHGPVARWNGHCPPSRRCGESFGPGGLTCSQALQVVSQELWGQYSMHPGDGPKVECPWTFD